MASRRIKSKRPSAGNPDQLLLDDFVLYLDENLDNCKAIINVLTELSIRFERHQSRFARGTPDEQWLGYAGEHRLLVLTKDKQNRYNDLERKKVIRSGVREFYFAAGNLSGQDMADALRAALPVMRRTCVEHQPPFVASISRSGSVTVVFDKDGSTHERRHPKRKSPASKD
jgi:hypothetical protein